MILTNSRSSFWKVFRQIWTSRISPKFSHPSTTSTHYYYWFSYCPQQPFRHRFLSIQTGFFWSVFWIWTLCMSETLVGKRASKWVCSECSDWTASLPDFVPNSARSCSRSRLGSTTLMAKVTLSYPFLHATSKIWFLVVSMVLRPFLSRLLRQTRH